MPDRDVRIRGQRRPIPKFDSADDAQQLLARDAEWVRISSEGQNIDSIVSYWSDDALVIPQGQPIAEGKAAIRAFVTASLGIPNFRIHWVSTSGTAKASPRSTVFGQPL